MFKKENKETGSFPKEIYFNRVTARGTDREKENREGNRVKWKRWWEYHGCVV